MHKWMLACVMLLGGCDTSSEGATTPRSDHGPAIDPDGAGELAVDRFSAEQRAADPDLPEPGAPIDFDDGFLHEGLGPDGGAVAYYGLGSASGFTMPAYLLVYEDGAPVPEQLAILTVIPGDVEYSDFWQVTRVVVPEDYVANSITSAQELLATEYPRMPTTEVFNRPLVPPGSKADQAISEVGPVRAWFDDQVVHAIDFAEVTPTVRGSLVDYARVYVCMTEEGFCRDEQGRTHNVIDTVPGDAAYSPLWRVVMYDPAAFEGVVDLPSAQQAAQPEAGGLANCPVVTW